MNKLLTTAMKAAKEAGVLIQSYKNRTDISYKNDKFNLVTKADKDAEEIIIDKINEFHKGHDILSEETRANTSVLSDNLWVIDPLDGTNNFASNIPQYCISIAYAEKGEVLLGVVYDPERNEMFTAVKNEGAFLNGIKINVSLKKNLIDSIIATGFYYDRGQIMEQTLNSINSLFRNPIRGIRRMGSAALDLCWVACGRFEGYFEYKLHPWDFAAGLLILKEANGMCSDKYGKDLDLSGEGIISSNGLIHENFLEIVKV